MVNGGLAIGTQEENRKGVQLRHVACGLTPRKWGIEKIRLDLEAEIEAIQFLALF